MKLITLLTLVGLMLYFTSLERIT